MRAMRAEQFSGYEALKLVDLPKPAVTDGKVLVRVTAAGVTPLDHTILFGNFHIPEVPLVLGNEGAGVVEEGGGTDFPVGSRVMFWGAYGAFEDGTYREWIAVRKEDLCLIPDNVDDVSAAGVPVAYLTAQIALTLAGFRPGKTVLAPAIGGSVGNAVTQLARALGAKHAISSTTNHAKAEQAKALGFNEVIDTSLEKLGDGVRRITDGLRTERPLATKVQHCRLALATSATPRNRMTNLNRLGIANLFEAVVDLGDVSEPKPSPEIYLTVTSRLALQPSQCLVVEDSLTGVLSAKHAGCCVSALTRTFEAHELLGAGADFIFEDFQSLKRSAEIEKYCR